MEPLSSHEFSEMALVRLGEPNARRALRDLVRTELDRGAARETLLGSLEALRSQVSDDQEDIVLEVMDALVGWCGPNEAL